MVWDLCLYAVPGMSCHVLCFMIFFLHSRPNGPVVISIICLDIFALRPSYKPYITIRSPVTYNNNKNQQKPSWNSIHSVLSHIKLVLCIWSMNPYRCSVNGVRVHRSCRLMIHMHAYMYSGECVKGRQNVFGMVLSLLARLATGVTLRNEIRRRHTIDYIHFN